MDTMIVSSGNGSNKTRCATRLNMHSIFKLERTQNKPDYVKIFGTIAVPVLNNNEVLTLTATIGNVMGDDSAIITAINRHLTYNGTFIPPLITISEGYISAPNTIAFIIKSEEENPTNAFNMQFSLLNFN